MKYTRFLCLTFMIKYAFKIMDMMDWLFIIRINYKKQLS